MTESRIVKNCECKNCGNEAEMEITCSLDTQAADAAKVVSEPEGKTKGHAVCASCGGEADIWLDV